MLARDWEAQSLLRNIARQHGGLTVWPETKNMGIASMRNCRANAGVLEVTTEWWVLLSPKPAAIPIDRVRAEASKPS